LRVLSVSRLLAESIRASFEDESVSAVFAGETQLF
jgi:phosphoribosylpyrophosphate synthetase